MVFARRSTTLLAAIIASCAMVLSLTACTSDNKTVVDGQTTVTSNSAGGVAVFTPSDGITLNQQVPLNKWAKLVPDLTKALVDAGFKKGDINHQRPTRWPSKAAPSKTLWSIIFRITPRTIPALPSRPTT